MAEVVLRLTKRINKPQNIEQGTPNVEGMKEISAHGRDEVEDVLL